MNAKQNIIMLKSVHKVISCGLLPLTTAITQVYLD